MENTENEVIRILSAISGGWALIDDDPKKDFMVLVNESREEMEDLCPAKELVAEIENRGLIADLEKSSKTSKHGTMTYFEKEGLNGQWLSVSKPEPIVYFYKITDKGKRLLNNSDSG